jgi:hypothetical protein
MKGRFCVKHPNDKDPEKLEIDGGLVLAAVASGLLAIPILGWLPLLAIGAAIGTAIYITDNIRPR